MQSSPWGVTLAAGMQPQADNLESPIQALFQGELESTLTCSSCGHSSASREEYLHLSVPVRERGPFDPIKLEEAFAEFAAEEILTGSDRWHCSECDTRVDATKRIRLRRVPPLLVVHLKRFAYSPEDRAIRKVRTLIELPESSTRGLDFGKYTAFPAATSAEAAATSPAPQEPPELLYDIVSIVNHHGLNAFCGHYTAHCRHCVEGAWYQYDDTRVTALEPAKVWLPGDAYVLCLLRRGWHRPFGPPLR